MKLGPITIREAPRIVPPRPRTQRCAQCRFLAEVRRCRRCGQALCQVCQPGHAHAT
jgi:hypothetical protein